MLHRKIPGNFLFLVTLLISGGLVPTSASAVTADPGLGSLLDADKCKNLQRLEKRVSGSAGPDDFVSKNTQEQEAEEIVYSEDYYVSLFGKQRQVLYRYPDQRIFFSKILDYSASDTEPDYIQADWRKMKVDLRLTRDGELFYGSIPFSELTTSKSGNASSDSLQVNEKTLIDVVCSNAPVNSHILSTLDQGSVESGESVRSLVVDAGFDDYVRKNWSKLMEGDSLRFAFLPAGRSSPVSMRIKRVGLSDCNDRFGASMHAGMSERPEPPPNGFFARAVINPIYLHYASNNQRLLGYHGLTNIKSDKGKPQSLRIVYRYYE